MSTKTYATCMQHNYVRVHIIYRSFLENPIKFHAHAKYTIWLMSDFPANKTWIEVTIIHIYGIAMVAKFNVFFSYQQNMIWILMLHDPLSALLRFQFWFLTTAAYSNQSGNSVKLIGLAKFFDTPTIMHMY